MLTDFLERWALYGVLAEIEAIGLDLLEVGQLPHGPQNHRNSVITAHRDDR